MRYVRCHECGSTEVPTLATCPTCGIKTPIKIRQRWWLMGVILVVGLGLGMALGYPAFGRPYRLQQVEDQVADLRDEVERQKRRAADAIQRLDDLKRRTAGLRKKPPEAEPRPPSPPPEQPAQGPPDDRLRVAHVRWAAAYRSVSRLWREPYVPLAYVRKMEPEVEVLGACTLEVSAALAAAGERAPAGIPEAALRPFGRQLAGLRQAIRPEARHRLTVGAQSDWRDSDFEVRPGDVVYVGVQGSWTMSVVGPSQEGEQVPVAEMVPLVGGLPLGAVLWRVRGGARVQAILPESGSMAARADAEGLLQFRINEQHVDDNAGAMTVEVMLLRGSLIAELDAAGLQLIGG